MIETSPAAKSAGEAGTMSPPRLGGGPNRAQERFEREAGARRAVFAATLASFIAAFGLIAASGKAAPPSGGNTASVAPALASGRQVIAEVPISDPFGSGDGRETIIRIVAPEVGVAPLAPAAPHVRTRAS